MTLGDGMIIFAFRKKKKKILRFDGTTIRSFRKNEWSFLNFCGRSVGLEANNT